MTVRDLSYDSIEEGMEVAEVYVITPAVGFVSVTSRLRSYVPCQYEMMGSIQVLMLSFSS